MPSDTEILARLKDAVDGVDFEESVTCDGDAIRWAVRRIGELEGALLDYGNHTPNCTADPSNPRWTGKCNCGWRELGRTLAPAAPAKEGEAKT